MAKTKIGLLFGGCSGEHEVSISSAKAIAKALSQEDNLYQYEVIPVYIAKNGVWFAEGVAQNILKTQKLLEEEVNQSRWQFPPSVSEIEVWFPILHGPNGEDGTVQGLLQLMQVPYVGSGVLGSAMGMDKIAMKTAFAKAGLSQVEYLGLTREQIHSNLSQCDEIEAAIDYPCFVKPANLGSSVGIAKVRNRQELKTALENAVSYDRRIIVEAGVTAREVECAVLGNDSPQVSIVGEISFDSDFYDYETKYTEGLAQLQIPAQIPADIAAKIQEMSRQGFAAVDAAGLARVDFFYVEATGEVLINEINTLPGFTATSMYPQLWAATDVSFPQLVDRLIQLAIERHQNTNTK